MPSLRSIAFALMVFVVAAPAAAAERVALLIGNQSYTSEIGKLGNPHNDIALLEKTLKGHQFEVTSVRDARHPMHTKASKPR
jgi:Caspase domain